MKRTIALILFTIICFSLCACDPLRYTADREALNAVISVELIEYENSEQKEFISWVPDQFDKLLPFILDNATVIEVLPDEKISDFSDAFAAADIFLEYYEYNSPKGICIKLNYGNGDFLIIWSDYIGEYSSDGSVTCFWGSFTSPRSYENLVNQYFTYKLQ